MQTCGLTSGAAAPLVQQQPSSPVTIAEPTKQLSVEVPNSPVQTFECIIENHSASRDIHVIVYLIAIQWNLKIYCTAYTPPMILNGLFIKLANITGYWIVCLIGNTTVVLWAYRSVVICCLFMLHCSLLAVIMTVSSTTAKTAIFIFQSLEANWRYTLTKVQTGSRIWCLQCNDSKIVTGHNSTIKVVSCWCVLFSERVWWRNEECFICDCYHSAVCAYPVSSYFHSLCIDLTLNSSSMIQLQSFGGV